MRDSSELAADVIAAFDARKDLREITLELAESIAASLGTTPLIRHVLGFAHIKFAILSGRTLRLHLWPAPLWEPLPPPWLIHTHGWLVESFVATGVVNNLLYDVVKADVGTHRLYEVAYVGGESERRATETLVNVHLKSTGSASRGDFYAVEPGVFHTSTTDGSFAATVVVTGPKLSSGPFVVGDLDGAKRYPYSPLVVADDVARNLLQELTRKLA
jgi:hypothetical protein